MTTATLAIAAFCFCLAVIVLWANPARFTNQVYSFVALLLTVWFCCAYNAMHSQRLLFTGDVNVFPFWQRANPAVAALLPWGVWLLKESIVARHATRGMILGRSLPWAGLSLTLAVLCYMENFITMAPGGMTPVRGTPYIVYIIVGVSAYIWLIVRSHLETRRQSGIRRIEMQFLTLNAGYVGLLVVGLLGLGNIIKLPYAKNLGIFVIFGSLVLTAWAITVHRIFDARQVFLALSHRAVVIVCVAATAWGLSSILVNVLPVTTAWIAGTVGALCNAFWIDRTTRTFFGFGAKHELSDLRREVIGIAESVADTGQLEAIFEQLLAIRCQTTVAKLLFDRGAVYAGSHMEFDRSRAGFAALTENGWATPESIQRRRPTPEREDLARLLQQYSLGVVLTVPQGSAAPSLLVALGTKTNEWPYTYPEVERLQNIAELMDNILTRSRLTAQAALQAKIEHLAMMSRGLAHDLKNLITPVSSFLIHTDERYPPASPEAEVHAAARHSVRVMTDYVREALFFSERLQPKLEPINLTSLFGAVRELTASRATARGVTLAAHSDYHEPLLADNVLLQRMLANLVGNAIDASAPGQTVTLSANSSRAGRLQIQVTDSGCGISPANLSRIFDPYFTTKEFGDDIRGFGLGLTICQKITNLHGGTISVQSELGKGTRVTVELPTNSPSRSLLPAPPCLALP